MAVGSDSLDRCVVGVRSPAGSAALARRHVLRHRLVVVGPSIDRMVGYVGGWLFDRMMAGWDVTAVVADPSDVRPLTMLGAAVVDMAEAMAEPAPGPVPDMIAIDTMLYETDSRVRGGVEQLLGQGVAIRMWGEHWPPGIDQRFDLVQHQPSVAAQAFKARALLAAAGSCDTADGIEMLRCSELLAPPSKTA